MPSQHRKKILYVITKSNWGGAQRYVHDLATNAPGEQFDVVVACGDAGNEQGELPRVLVRKLTAKGIRVIFIPSFTRNISITKELSAFRELKAVCREVHPDIVHVNSSKAGGIGVLAARACGVSTVIFTVHGWPFRERHRNFLWRLFALFGSWLTALFSTSIICVSESDLRTARTLPFVGHKAVRIYNGIDLHMHFGSGEKIRSAFPADVTISGSIGELNENKNHVALIKQARSDPNMYVAIVGEGELHHALEREIEKYHLEKRVRLFGFMPAAEVLKGFDRFVLPSLKEGLPYVLLEARLAGLPITANRVGGIGEILDAKDLSEFSLEQMLERTYALYESRP
ncbi:MAG TPA: glycosyltransferase [Candidatus Paceibacterota bacterium]|jgi:glycosyltransferase involved in cell wall biosynthesis